MRFQLFSDMHLEFAKSFPRIPRLAPTLILAGDIGNLCASTTAWRPFLQYCSETWSDVVYVAGNHEFYDDDRSHGDLLVQYREQCAAWPNVHFLDNEECTLLDEANRPWSVYGFTGWTPSPYTKRTDLATVVLNDYHRISEAPGQRMTPAFVNALSDAGVAKFVAWASAPKPHPAIVVSHFPPFRTGSSSHVHTHTNTRIKAMYFSWPDQNPLLDAALRTPAIRCWVSGHTHFSYDATRPSTVMGARPLRLVSNQVGYQAEALRNATNVSLDGVFAVDDDRED